MGSEAQRPRETNIRNVANVRGVFLNTRSVAITETIDALRGTEEV